MPRHRSPKGTMQITSEFKGSGGGAWLTGDGAHGDIVISSRVRLARNLRGHRFLLRADAAERAEIEQELRGALGRVAFPSDMTYLDLDGAPPLEADLLVERHLISRELAKADGPRGACFSSDEDVAIMVCEEDHLRLQVLRSGFELSSAWESADALDDLLAKEVGYAFTRRYGYLTCCPTNVGTGMRASVMLHLPALVYTKHIEQLFRAGNAMNLAVRGLFGEGAQPLGDFFQISNQVALGVSEEDILDRLNKLVPQFIAYEKKLRASLLADDREALEDKVWRALGILKSARTITSEEALEQLSALRLGVNLSLLPDTVTLQVVNGLFLATQPAHLQKFTTGQLDPKARDIARAALLRSQLGALE